MNLDSVLVVGGINCDISASVTSPIVPRTSNPGLVGLSPGGVGRNIAHTLALLGVPVRLLGAVGSDPLSDWVLERTVRAGVDVSGVMRPADGTAGVYVSILADGELEVAVSDMAAMDVLDGETVRRLLNAEPLPRYVVADCNLPAAALQSVLDWAAAHQVGVVMEPVSVAKAERIGELTGSIDIVTPNRDEAAVLARLDAAGRLPDIAAIVVTRGAEGASFFHVGEPVCHLVPARRTTTRNANGAGDAFVAGLVAALAAGRTMADAVGTAVALGSRTAASPTSVAEDLSPSFLTGAFEG